MICRSQRSAKSAACSSENVVGVSSRRCLPRLVADFTSGEEFHSVKCSRYPPISSQRFSKYSCVLLPEPSVPSTTISAPGYARLGTGRPGCGSVDFPASGRGGAFCCWSWVSVTFVGTIDSIELQRTLFLLQIHYNTAQSVRAKRRTRQKTVTLKCKNFLGFCRKSPISKRRSPVSPVRLSYNCGSENIFPTLVVLLFSFEVVFGRFVLVPISLL